MASIPTGSSGMIRLGTDRMSEYLYADKPKLSFWQKLGRGAGKAMSFLGPIGAAVTAIAVPGAGLPIAAGLYGLSNVSAKATSDALSKDAAKMQAYESANAQKPIYTPGLFDGMSASGLKTDFIVPETMQSQALTTISDRSLMNQRAVENFQF